MVFITRNLNCYYFIHFFRFLPESPRWLLSQERYDETLTIMTKIGKVNGKCLDPDELLAKLKVKKSKYKSRLELKIDYTSIIP